MTRSTFLLGAVAAVVTGAVSAGTFGASGVPTGTSGGAKDAFTGTAARAAQARPNIVLITTDDQTVADLSAMPNVQRLLTRQGTQFSDYNASFPLCGPARASILTGQYAHNHGVLANDPPVGGYPAMDPRTTFATRLESAGYQTALVGKYVNRYGEVKPLSAPPGWTDWHGEVAGGNYYDTRLFENGTLHEYKGPYQVDLVSNISTRLISHHVPQAAPFFIWESYAAPHVGLPREPDDPGIETPAVPQRFRNSFAGVPLHKDASFNEADVSDKPQYVSSREKLTGRMLAMLTESHQQRLESLQAVDEAVKKTVDALRSAGELNNTVIVFTTDNGYMMGEHRIHAGKDVPYSPSMTLPLIVRGPGFPAGVTRNQLVADTDLAPTFLDIAGAPSSGLVFDGQSLLPVAASRANGLQRHVLIETGGPDGRTPEYAGVRTPTWQYIRYSTGEEELYNLANDPLELRNQASNAASAKQLDRMAAMLSHLRHCAGANCR